MKKNKKTTGVHYVIEQRNKYLDDLGLAAHTYGTNFTDSKDDARRKEWKKQKKKYGFDSRETWCMSDLFIQWLYSHLIMYKKEAGKIIDLEYHKVIFDGKEYTQKQAIKKMIKWLRYYLIHNDDEDIEISKRAYEKATRAARLWAVTLHYMSW